MLPGPNFGKSSVFPSVPARRVSSRHKKYLCFLSVFSNIPVPGHRLLVKLPVHFPYPTVFLTFLLFFPARPTAGMISGQNIQHILHQTCKNRRCYHRQQPCHSDCKTAHRTLDLTQLHRFCCSDGMSGSSKSQSFCHRFFQTKELTDKI